MRAAFGWTALLIAPIALLAACSGGSAAPTAPPTPGAAPTNIEAAPLPATCSPARPHAAGDFVLEVAGAGSIAPVLLHVPASYEGSVRSAVVLDFHGGVARPESPQQHFVYTALFATADAHGFILVTPPNEGVVAAGAVLDAVEALLCVDPDRVFATGLSRGARLSSSLGCGLGGRIAAIAPVAGVQFPGATCVDAGPAPVIAFHGTADTILPFEGARGAVADWAEHNGCGLPEPEQVSEHVILVRHAGCDRGAAVHLYIVEGGGHTWPGAASRGGPPGSTTTEISANELMWAFFEAHPRQRGAGQ